MDACKKGLKTRDRLDGFQITCIIFIALLIIFLGFLIWASIDNTNKLNQMMDGWVVDKIYQEPYSYITMQQTGNIKIPITHQVSASYIIVVSNGEVDAQIEVPEDIYRKYKVGDYLENINRELK